MSYCRFSNADIYLYEDIAGYICCCACLLTESEWVSIELYSPQEALDHVKKHREAGHNVPEYVDERLKREIEQAQE